MPLAVKRLWRGTLPRQIKWINIDFHASHALFYKKVVVIAEIFYCLKFETPLAWRARALYLYPPGKRLPSHSSRHLQLCSLQHREIKVKVIIRPTVSRPVCPGVRPLSGARDQFFFLLEIVFTKLHVWYYGARSLWREDGPLIYSCCWALPGVFVIGTDLIENNCVAACFLVAEEKCLPRRCLSTAISVL
jgi:hypothetical protein